MKFTIKRHQIIQLSRHHVDDFLKRLRQAVAIELPAQTHDDTALMAALQRARAAGAKTEHDVATLTLEILKSTPGHPEAQISALLDAPHVRPSTKSLQLRHLRTQGSRRHGP